MREEERRGLEDENANRRLVEVALVLELPWQLRNFSDTLSTSKSPYLYQRKHSLKNDGNYRNRFFIWILSYIYFLYIKALIKTDFIRGWSTAIHIGACLRVLGACF